MTLEEQLAEERLKTKQLKELITFLVNPSAESLSRGADAVRSSASVWEGFEMLDAKCCFLAILGEQCLLDKTKQLDMFLPK